MIVEFIGSTGAGKSTLIREVQNRLAKSTAVSSSYEVVAESLGLQKVKHPTVRNLVQEVIGLPYFLRYFGRHKEFITFNLKMLARHGKFTFIMFNDLRSLERKIGIYEVLRHKQNGQVIIFDEGTVLQSHHLFVFTDAEYTPEEIEQFVNFLPLPDAIVYIRAPIEDLLRRSMQRSNPPRAMKKKNQAAVEKFLNRAVTMFSQLIKTEQIERRLLIVDNPDTTDNGFDDAVNKISEFILNYEPA